MAIVIKAAVRRISGPEAAKAVSGHSLRAGYCTEAAIVGLQPYQIRERTGHKSDETLARYIVPWQKGKSLVYCDDSVCMKCRSVAEFFVQNQGQSPN